LKILLIIISFTYALFALEINQENVNISNFNVKYLESNSSEFTIETILNQKFTQTTTNKHSFGLSKDKTIWVKTDITVNSDIKKLYLQQADTVSVTNIELYFFKDKKLLKRVKSGVENKETDGFDALLKVDVEKGGTYTFLAKYSTKNSLILNMNIFDEQHYYNYKKYMHMIFAIFLGVMGALLIYNIYLYFALKYIQYLYYSMMVLGLSIFTMAQAGIFIEFLPVSINFHKYLNYAVFLKIVFFYLFTQQILNTKKTMPYVHIYFNFTIVTTILTFLYVVFTSSIYDYIQNLYNIFLYGAIVGLSILLWAMYRRVPFIYHYSLASVPPVIVAIIWSSLFLGYIDYSYMSRYGYMYASMYEIITYSILVSYYIKQMQKENTLQKSIMYQSEKQASLGELLVYITHQWRAPLASLNALITLSEAKLKHNVDITKKDIEENIVKNKNLLKFMTETINNFTTFYNPTKEKTNFSILDSIENIILIIEKELMSHKIDLTIKGDKNLLFYGIKNDLSQIVLALISNAKHVFIERSIENPKIEISFYKQNSDVFIEVSDNAGGIKLKPIETIFEPFISGRIHTQSGIGLYMVKNILDSYNSEISVKNINNGAKFTIILKEV